MLFKRNASLVITAGVQYPGGQAAFGQNISISGLRIVFQIEKTYLQGGNRGSIRVYNAAPETRVKLEKYGASIVLFVGYGDEAELLFRGDIIRASTEREGPDILITLDCVDGFWATKTSILNVSLSPGEDVRVLFDKIVDAMKLPVKVNEGLQPRAFATGYTFSGTAVEALRLVCANNKPTLAWSVQDGNLHLRPENEPLKLPAIELSSRNGLIGYPAKTKNGITATSLLNAKLQPGRELNVTSDRFVGVLSSLENRASDKWREKTSGPSITSLLQRVQHRGDTHGQDWVSSLEATILV